MDRWKLTSTPEKASRTTTQEKTIPKSVCYDSASVRNRVPGFRVQYPRELRHAPLDLDVASLRSGQSLMCEVDRILNLNLPAFEPINQRRGGWSGVAMVTCAGRKYFIKRQKNHSYREPRRVFRRTPTLRREYRNTLRLQALRIPTTEIGQ